MDLNIDQQVAAMRRMTVGQLRSKYAEVFGESTHARHKQWLVRRIAWRMQALVEGDLSQRARRRAAELANDADLRMLPPRITKPAPATARASTASDDRLPMPGTIITRQYKGQALQVRVLPEGFEFEGQTYKSLSAVAKVITGSHCNGYHFFRLAGRPQ